MQYHNTHNAKWKPLPRLWDQRPAKPTIHDLRGGRLKTITEGCKYASWNVEGFTDEKQIALQRSMTDRRIGVLCLQETHKRGSDYFITSDGFLVIFSGTSTGDREHAGVGFLVAPWMRKYVVSFTQPSSRFASLKIRVKGGKINLITAYAPHNGYPYADRQRFFSELGDFENRLSGHGPNFVFGDMNSRLYRRLPGEETVLGGHTFWSDEPIITDDMNRHLLVEFCVASNMVFTNTLFDVPIDKQVTCYNIGSHPMDPICWRSHGQIDFLLAPRDWINCISSVQADRTIALPTHHFLLEAVMHIELPTSTGREHRRRLDVSALSDTRTAKYFATRFDALMEQVSVGVSPDVNLVHARIVDSFHGDADVCLPSQVLKPTRPWISSRTLSLLTDRNNARSNGNFTEERRLSKSVKSAVAQDRSAWLNNLVADGDWSAIRRLRKGFAKQQGRLKDALGTFVSSDQRADTLGQYLQDIQWAVRPTQAAPPKPPLFEMLPVELADITEDEVIYAGRKLKRNRACGLDGVPAEFWKAITQRGSTSLQWAVEFCRLCWSNKQVPNSWHESRVALIFKKGDPSDCGNYRPITLLPIGYKLFATILLERLRKVGAEARLWPTQFGFLSGRSTRDAIFIARRYLEESWATQNGKVVLLALDWAKAFDSVSPAALSDAMRRFGIPSAFIDMISAIYSDRRFLVKDAGLTSSWYKQEYGICQGCPLSPFLFVILMTTLLHDSKASFVEEHGQMPSSPFGVDELVYADDTLLVGVNARLIQSLMVHIGKVGRTAGLSFN